MPSRNNQRRQKRGAGGAERNNNSTLPERNSPQITSATSQDQPTFCSQTARSQSTEKIGSDDESKTPTTNPTLLRRHSTRICDKQRAGKLPATFPDDGQSGEDKKHDPPFNTNTRRKITKAAKRAPSPTRSLQCPVCFGHNVPELIPVNDICRHQQCAECEHFYQDRCILCESDARSRSRSQREAALSEISQLRESKAEAEIQQHADASFVPSQQDTIRGNTTQQQPDHDHPHPPAPSESDGNQLEREIEEIKELLHPHQEAEADESPRPSQDDARSIETPPEYRDFGFDLAFQVANHGSLLRFPPPAQRRSFSEACSIPCRALLIARESKDADAYEAAIFDLFKFPSRTLAIPHDGKNINRHVKAALEGFIEGDIAETEMTHSDPSDAETRKFKRAKRLLRAGAPGKAAAALLQHPTITTDEIVLQKLRQLHPPPKDELPSPPPVEAIALPISERTLIRYIKQLPKCSAPGPSGWTYEAIRDVIANATCKDAIVALINDIVTATIPQRAATILISATLVPIAKGQHADSGIRPVAIGEAFYRIATGCLLQEPGIAEAIRKILCPLQLGSAVPGGCEAAVHLLQAAAEDESNKRGILLVDLVNAFNVSSRQKMLVRLYSAEQLQRLFAIAYMAYGKYAPLFVRAGNSLRIIVSDNGSRQGDPLAALMFCLGIHDTFERIAKAAANTIGVAILDDLSVVAPPEAVRAILDEAHAAVAADGLEINMRKTAYLWPHRDELPDMPIAVYRGAASVLGVPVGNDIRGMVRLANDVAHSHSSFFTDLKSHKLSNQESFLLLRVCATPKLGYLLRCARPEVTTQAAERFDSMVMDAFCARAHIDPGISEAQVNQIRMPLRLGGFGLTANAPKAAICWFAAQSQAAHQLVEYGIEKTSQRMRASVDAIVAIREVCGEKAFHLLPPDDFKGDVQWSCSQPKRLQQQLTATMNDHNVANAISTSARTSDPHTHRSLLARMYAAKAPKASSWLRIIPSFGALRLSDDCFRVAVRLRLGLPPTDHADDQCGLCHSDMQLDPWHHLNCLNLRSQSHTQRHDRVVKRIAQWCHRLGLSARIEPRTEDERQRPDLSIVAGTKRYLVDVTVVNPLALSNLAVASSAPLATAEKAAKLKLTKYADLAKRSRATFVPFAVETTGGFCKAAVQFVKDVTSAASKLHFSWCPSEEVRGLLPSIAAAVQSGNAHAVSLGMFHAAPWI